MSESYAFIDNSTDIQILAMRKIVRKIVILRKIFCLNVFTQAIRHQLHRMPLGRHQQDSTDAAGLLKRGFSEYQRWYKKVPALLLLSTTAGTCPHSMGRSTGSLDL